MRRFCLAHIQRDEITQGWAYLGIVLNFSCQNSQKLATHRTFHCMDRIIRNQDKQNKKKFKKSSGTYLNCCLKAQTPCLRDR